MHDSFDQEGPELAESESETVEGSTSGPTQPGEIDGRPRKRRRRRGRGKGRRREGEPASSGEVRPESPPGESDEPSEPEEDDEQPMYNAAGDDADDDDLEGGKPSHRGIPHWEEAVGMIIATNMEARAKNPNVSSGAPRGRRGRGRGRGR